MTDITEKRCTGSCGLVKPVSEFYINKRLTSGYYSKCKSCLSKDHTEWHSNNKASVLARHVTNYRANKKSIIARTSKWQKNNKKLRAIYSRRCKDKHPHIFSANAAKYRAAKLQRTVA